MSNNQNFPFLFAREAADSIFKLEKLVSQKSIEIVNEILEVHEKLEIVKRTIDNLLFKQIKEESNELLRSKFLNTKRDIYNDRDFTIENIRPHLSKELNSEFELYFQLYKAEKKLDNQGNKIFGTERERITTILFEFSKKEYLTKGLVFSSPTLLKRLKYKKQKLYKDFNKKDHKLEFGLTQYLSRCLTKTSPFSTFNSIQCYKKNTEDYIPYAPKKQSTVRLNTAILYFIREILEECPIVQNHILIKTNPTLSNKKNHLNYFYNNNNNEYFKKVNNSDFLLYIIKDVSNHKITLIDIIERALKVIDADKKTIKNYVLNLIEEGILNWDFPIVASDPKWTNKLIIYLQNISKLESVKYVDDIILIIIKLLDNAKNIENSNTQVREIITKQSYDLLHVFLSSKNKNLELGINEKNIYYEDYANKPTKSISIDVINKVKEELGTLYNIVPNQEIRENQLFEVIEFFKFKYPNKNEISLLTFYEDFYSEYKKNSISLTQNIEKDERSKKNVDINLLKVLLEKQKYSLEKINKKLNLNLKNSIKHLSLNKIILENNLKEKENCSSTASYFQFVTNTEKPLIVINNSASNTIKPISRFLYLYDNKTTEELRNYLKKRYTNGINTSINDASVFSINIFPDIVDHHIDINADSAKESNYYSKNISLNELSIELKNNTIFLKNSRNQIINIFNCSLENIKYKSNLFQLLNLFSPDYQYDNSILTQTLNSIFKEKQSDFNVKILPRIYFGKHIIIQRKTWVVKTNQIPTVSNNEWHSFLLINKFRKKHKIPFEVFVTISEKGTERIDDNYKPQYINFKSPVFVKLFTKLINRSSHEIKIIEMLPNTEQIRKMNEEKVKEYIL